ncbi:unnamed protein product [Phaedon cochleariae]|uniref:Regulator of microtubule dynamics protein 1 n=1 Tax=Phaedon cochleariae TaxID=80249 RepID=A0A9P0DB83_PHACE|nr:unnamed protein product [Phaedon cochleariae]
MFYRLSMNTAYIMNNSIACHIKNFVHIFEEMYTVWDKKTLTKGKKSPNIHKWLAIVLDAHHGQLGLEQRVKASSAVRDHLARACELDPRDFAAHYMLGKWHFQMGRLTWVQRTIAKYFIAAEPPRTTHKQAYKYLSKAEDLQPRTFLPNLYLLGKTCIEMGQYYKAKYYLHLAMNLPPKDDCDNCCVWMARQLVMKLDRYDLGKNVLYYDPLGFID